MVKAAEERDVVLHCDHTFCYTPAVQKIRDLVAAGELGRPLYYDSVRVNLGLVQEEVDVFWDLAPHDISILDFILGIGPRDPLGDGGGRRPARPRPRLRRLPHDAVQRRPAGSLPPQLAEPDEDPHDDRRRLRADGRLERPAPGPAGERLRVGHRPRRDRPLAGGAAAPKGVLSHRQHDGAGAARAGGAARACWRTGPAPSAPVARR